MNISSEVTSHRPRLSSWIGEHFALVLAAIMAVAALCYALGTGLIWPHTVDGDQPFSDDGGATLGFGGTPGDRFILVDWLSHGQYEDVITLDSITPSETASVWRVTDVAIGVRRPGEPYVTAGVYPSVGDDDWQRCDAQPIETEFPYEVQPGEEIMLVQVMELLSRGKDRLPPAEVRFRRNGVRFASHPGMHLEVAVTDKARPSSRESTWEYACEHPEQTF